MAKRMRTHFGTYLEVWSAENCPECDRTDEEKKKKAEQDKEEESDDDDQYEDASDEFDEESDVDHGEDEDEDEYDEESYVDCNEEDDEDEEDDEEEEDEDKGEYEYEYEDEDEDEEEDSSDENSNDGAELAVNPNGVKLMDLPREMVHKIVSLCDGETAVKMEALHPYFRSLHTDWALWRKFFTEHFQLPGMLFFEPGEDGILRPRFSNKTDTELAELFGSTNPWKEIFKRMYASAYLVFYVRGKYNHRVIQCFNYLPEDDVPGPKYNLNNKVLFIRESIPFISKEFFENHYSEDGLISSNQQPTDYGEMCWVGLNDVMVCNSVITPPQQPPFYRTNFHNIALCNNTIKALGGCITDQTVTMVDCRLSGINTLQSSCHKFKLVDSVVADEVVYDIGSLKFYGLHSLDFVNCIFIGEKPAIKIVVKEDGLWPQINLIRCTLYSNYLYLHDCPSANVYFDDCIIINPRFEIKTETTPRPARPPPVGCDQLVGGLVGDDLNVFD